MTKSKTNTGPNSVTVFPTRLGWMAIVGSGKVLRQLSVGHRSAKEARAALDPELTRDVRTADWNPSLVRRLQAYAAGKAEPFWDVAVDPGPQTPFQRRVTACCREIPPGQTLSYGQLATKAGSPGPPGPSASAWPPTASRSSYHATGW